VLPELTTEAMQLFLDRFAATIPPGDHAVMVMDQAGWHITDGLKVPLNMSLVQLPPYSPELNPVERVWLYLRERYFSHRLLDSYGSIADALCIGWNKLTATTLASLTEYPYLNQVKFEAGWYHLFDPPSPVTYAALQCSQFPSRAEPLLVP
jgi:hypothetical protein